jgi:WD40 repeat protein/serine/threonine protein kinase
MATPTLVMPSPCPDERTLQRFLRDELSTEDAGRVDHHLGACPACQRFLDRLIGKLPPGLLLSAGAPGAAEQDGPPALPGYETLGPVAAGGMGVVWRVRDQQFGRELAVKVLKSSSSGHASGVERFLAEARITGRLAHPFIVPVHALGRLPDGRPYYAMKLVLGRTLAELLKGRPDLTSGRTEFLRIFSQVCQAVAFAHGQSVIHRDLKPHNVMVGEHGEVQVMDWGLAKVLPGADAPAAEAAGGNKTADETRHETGEHTEPGSVVGTWAYMPPEQANGRVIDVDRQSDVFGLGAIMCELLTGHPPYRATEEEVDQAVGKDSADLGRADTEERAKARTAIVCQKATEGDLADAWDRLRGCGADSELIRLAARCLAPDKATRPVDASEVTAAIEAYLAAVQERLHEAEMERAATAVRLRAERRTRRVALGLMGLAAAVLLMGLATTLYFFFQAHVEAERARTHESQARRVAALSTWDRGRQLCEEGDVGHGLLVLSRAMEMAPQGREGDILREALKLELAIWHRFGPTLLNVLRPPDKVLAMAVSPDSKTVLTGGAGGKVYLWNLESSQLLHTIEGHQKAVRTIAFGKQFILTGSEDATACVWDATTHNRIGTLHGHTEAVCAVALSPDGKTALTGSADRTARLWDLPACTPRDVPLAHTSSVVTAAFSPDGETFLTGGENKEKNHRGQQKGEIRMWKTTTAKQVGSTILRDRSVLAATFSPDGTMLLIGDDNWEGTLWDLKSHMPIAQVEPKGSVLGVAFSADSDTMLTGAGDSAQAHLWDVRALRGQWQEWREQKQDRIVVAPKPLGPSLPHPSPVTGVAFVDQRGETLVTACQDGCVRVWRKALGPLPQKVLPHSRGTGGLTAAFDPSGKAVATGGADQTVKLWNAATGALDGELRLEPRNPSPQRRVRFRGARTVAFMGNQPVLLIDCRGGDIRSWNLRSREVTYLPLPSEDEVAFETVSPDGRWILTLGRDGTTRRWLPTGTRPQIGPKQPHIPGGINLASLSVATIDPAGQFILAGDDDGGRAQLWDVHQGKLIGNPMEHHNKVTAAAFSPDCHTALTGSSDGRARLWNAAAGESLDLTLSHRGTVLAAAFSPDGRWILTGGRDDVGSQLWDARLGKPIGPRHRHADDVLDIAFHPDGKTVVMAHADGVAVLESVPAPVEGQPEQITWRVQAAVGMQLDEGGGRQALTGELWLEVRERLRQLGEQP